MAKQKPPAGRKPGQIVARGLDKWLVRIYLGMSADGKRQYVSKVISGKFKQAQA
jgi:integrase